MVDESSAGTCFTLCLSVICCWLQIIFCLSEDILLPCTKVSFDFVSWKHSSFDQAHGSYPSGCCVTFLLLLLSLCCLCRLSWWCGAGGARAAEGDATALWTVGSCQLCLGQPKKPTRWQVQPHPGLRSLFFIGTLFFFLFFKDNSPTHHPSLPPHQPVTFCHPSPTSLTPTRCHIHGRPCPLPPPSNLSFGSFFLLK